MVTAEVRFDDRFHSSVLVEHMRSQNKISCTPYLMSVVLLVNAKPIHRMNHFHNWPIELSQLIENGRFEKIDVSIESWS
jgi:hypothetical protein